MHDDYWEKVKTKHGYKADEVISALQKSIRRGNEENALFFSYEMMVSGNEMADKFWQRLRVIVIEDIGLANPILSSIIYTLHQNFIYLAGKEDRFLQGIFAALLLTRSKKSRYVDEVYNNLKLMIEKENYRLKIPDYAYDMHTKQGKKMKRGFLHFWQIGALLKNDLSENEKKHYQEIIRRLKKK